MENETGGPSPHSAQADKATIPAPAPAETSSLPKTQDPILSEVQKANTPAERRALAERLLRQAKEPKPAPESAPPAGDPPQETPAAAPATPESTDNDQADSTPEIDPEAAPEATGQPEEGDQPTIPTAKQLRVTLPDGDKVGRLASSFLRRNRDWTMEQALEAARNQLGVKPAETAAPEAPKPNADLPQDITGVDAAIDTLEAERLKAASEVRFEDGVKIDAQIRRLERHRINLERNEEKQQAQAVADYSRGFAESEKKASDLYTDASNPNSAFGKRMAEIEAELKDNGDELYYSADKPLKISQMVAAEMNIAPRRKGTTPAAPAKPAVLATNGTPPKKNVLPGGASRTTPVTAPQNTMKQEIESVKTVAEMRALKAKYGIRSM